MKRGEEHLMEYFATEFNLNILSEGFRFWKYITKGRWLKEILKHFLNKTYVSPKARALISRIYSLSLRPELEFNLLIMLAKC